VKILLTNDDGIDSEGLQKMAELLRYTGKYKVIIVAPDKNRSGISHAISMLNVPVKLSKLGDDTWSCSGTPADCIIISSMGFLPEKPDLVLSGINKGANLGTDIIYSGTAAGARQAGLSGIPAIALSLCGKEAPYNWDMAASWVVEHLEVLFAFWKNNCFINVNIPNRAEGPEGFIHAWPAIKDYGDTLSVTDAPEGGFFCSLIAGKESVFYEADSDCDVVSRNFVSVSTLYNFPAVLRSFCPGAPDYAAVAARS